MAVGVETLDRHDATFKEKKTELSSHKGAGIFCCMRAHATLTTFTNNRKKHI